MPKHFWPLVALGAVVVLIIAINVWQWSTSSAIDDARKSGIKTGIEQQEKDEKARAVDAQHKATREELYEALKRLSAAGGGRQSVLKDVEVTAKKP
jgi:F0F1-type ATP synthase membrane subunit b/b'